jgi:tetratricopeptide (TPR) repeat protein
LEGRSLLPLLRGDDWDAERSLFAEAESPFFTYGWSRLQSVRQGSLKFIDAPVAELYDLAEDPDEYTNLADNRGADVQRLAVETEAWSARGGESGSAAPVDAKTAEMLLALGYSAGDPGRPEGEGHGNPVELIAVHEELQAIHGLMVSGQFVDAVDRVRRVLIRDPENLSALRDLSRGLVQLGKLDEAAEVATRASSVAPWSTQALMVEADVEYRRGHNERALELIEQALDLDARFLEARLDRSRYLAALGRRDEAIREIEPLLEESADNHWVALRYAEIVDLPAEDFRGAEDRLRTVLSQNPYLVEAWMLLGKVFSTEGRSSEAAAVYREALTYRANSADLQTRLALLLAESAQPEAEPALREAIRTSSAARADLHVALGELLASTGRGEEARQQFEIAARAATFSAGTRNAEAMALLRLGRVAEAESRWRDLIRDHPDYGRSWLNMASLSIQRKNWSEAERFARGAVEREPRSSPAWNNLAIGLEELGRPGEAEAAYRRASEVDANDWRGLFNLGILLRKSARYGEAATVQQEVLKRSPTQGGAHFELGVLYAGPLANIERARVHLQAAIGADPNHPRARQARAILNQLP